MNTAANEKQVAGAHYRTPIQHWDYVVANDLDYFQGQITKYITRWKKKNGLTDLLKAQHFLEKYLEVAKAELEAIEQYRLKGEDAAEGEPTPGYVNQDR